MRTGARGEIPTSWPSVSLVPAHYWGISSISKVAADADAVFNGSIRKRGLRVGMGIGKMDGWDTKVSGLACFDDDGLDAWNAQ